MRGKQFLVFLSFECENIFFCPNYQFKFKLKPDMSSSNRKKTEKQFRLYFQNQKKTPILGGGETSKCKYVICMHSIEGILILKENIISVALDASAT